MTYRGTVKNGVIVLEAGAPLPEGTEVELAPVSARGRTVWEKLVALAGTVDDLPADAAEQVDHYLYGTPKR